MFSLIVRHFYLKEWAREYPKDGQIHCHVSWHLLAGPKTEHFISPKQWAVARRTV
jgi:hypothetical protein